MSLANISSIDDFPFNELYDFVIANHPETQAHVSAECLLLDYIGLLVLSFDLDRIDKTIELINEIIKAYQDIDILDDSVICTVSDRVVSNAYTAIIKIISEDDELVFHSAREFEKIKLQYDFSRFMAKNRQTKS